MLGGNAQDSLNINWRVSLHFHLLIIYICKERIKNFLLTIINQTKFSYNTREYSSSNKSSEGDSFFDVSVFPVFRYDLFTCTNIFILDVILGH